MKKLVIVFILAASLCSCDKFVNGPHGLDDSSQNTPSNIPSAVKNAFNAKYPTASRMEWEPEDGNTWKVKFYLDGVRWEAFFNADGSFISANIK
ncbi:hypothetical protein [Flavihumibacter fluvii]|uniref:hypothetical protein n=1 Tax=Flavihumibacter fluvii TaxID=2838157 RepID=UPI001BDEE3B8|nr:hypothetical protein [Flavihumibacter fluvii]ULQ53171.1 hypothetical protein KJS93_02415 [Flavihumibacter fluvii]